MSLFLGCPRWGLKEWVGNFFPPKTQARDFLTLYSRRLNTVEGNTTFYAIPNLETAARWRATTPSGFKFCLKFPKVISHERGLRAAEAETRSFLAVLERLGERCGPSFLQLPPKFGSQQLATLTAYLDSLPRDFRYAVEVRHPDFFADPAEAALDEALRRRGVARVLFDVRGLRQAQAAPDDEAVITAQQRKPDVPVRFTHTAPFVFVRFIADPDLTENAPLLDDWAQRVAEWLAADEDVFFFLHSPDDVQAPRLARDFHARVAAHHPLPPLPPWGDEAESPVEQPSLF